MSDQKNQTQELDSEKDESKKSEKLPRRPFLQATSAALLGASFAGCQGDGDSDTGGDDGGDSSGEDTSTMEQTSSGEDLNGVEFDFWETRYYQESTAAEEGVNQLISDFEEQTGATVNANLQTETQPLFDALNQGTYPPAFTEFAQGMASYMDAEPILSFSEYQDEFDYDIMDSIGAQADAVDYTFRGWEEGAALMPITSNNFAPFVGRMDLFEEAGLDPEEDFPPESYDDLVETANTLRDNSSAQVGYQPIGAQSDNHDVYFRPWNSALGGSEGYLFQDDDWGAVNVMSDTWRTTLQRNLDLYHEHGQGTNGTPTMTDEDLVNLQISGQVAMGNHAPMNLPAFSERGGQTYEENIRWAPHWEGETGENARSLLTGGVVTDTPEGADEATWETKQDAAIALLQHFNSPSLQAETMPQLGFMPVRRDVWPDISNDMIPGNYIQTQKEMAENAIYGTQAHPLRSEIYDDGFAAYQQQAFAGEMSVDEVMEQTQQRADEALDGSRWRS